MKAAPFRSVRPTSLPQALAALAEADGEARVLAGGQSLVPMLNRRLVRPDTVVDVNRGPASPASARGRGARWCWARWSGTRT